MATTIKLKNSVTTTNTPTSLAQGEVAINITDKKVWVGNAATTPIQLLGAGSSGSFGALTCTSLTNSGLTSGRVTYATTAGLLTDSANMTFNGTTLTVADLTDSSLTANRVVYAGTAGNLQSSANLTFNGTTLTTANDASISGLTVGKGGGAVSSNTVVGANALRTNTTGTLNTAFGAGAGELITTGSNNSYFGGYAGAQGASSTGSSNSGFGYFSLASITSGANNTAIGTQSLFSNTTASENTAVGYRAGYTGTTAGYNTIIGTNAAYSITTGSYNTIVGREAGYNLTTGTSNFFFGNSAGGNITTGSKNVVIGSYGGNSGGLDIRTASNYIVLSDGDGNPRGIFDNNGSFLVNTTSATGASKFVVAADTTTTNPMTVSNTRSTAATDYSILFYRNGSIVGSVQTTLSATSYVTSSDYRLKENIAPMTGALAKVTQLKPVTYTWKSDGSNGQGFIAHELQEVVPDCVTGEKDAVNEDGTIKPQGIDTSFLVATLTAAIQEQQAQIEELKAEVDSLKAQLNK